MVKSIGKFMIENYKCIFKSESFVVYSNSELRPIPHRLDGPAIEYSDGYIWCFDGKKPQLLHKKNLKKC